VGENRTNYHTRSWSTGDSLSYWSICSHTSHTNLWLPVFAISTNYQNDVEWHVLGSLSACTHPHSQTIANSDPLSVSVSYRTDDELQTHWRPVKEHINLSSSIISFDRYLGPKNVPAKLYLNLRVMKQNMSFTSIIFWEFWCSCKFSN